MSSENPNDVSYSTDTDGGRSPHQNALEELGDEYEEGLLREAVEAVEGVGAEPTVEHIEAVLSDVESEIDAAATAVEKLSAGSLEGGEQA